MPRALQAIMDLSPSTHFVRFAQAVLYRGAGIGAVWRDLLIMAGLGTAFVAIALSRFKAMLARQS
jgi:ABC-2 type transport system permease protein